MLGMYTEPYKLGKRLAGAEKAFIEEKTKSLFHHKNLGALTFAWKSGAGTRALSMQHKHIYYVSFI